MPLRLCRLEAKRKKNIHCLRLFIVHELHLHNSHTLTHNKIMDHTVIQSTVHKIRLVLRLQQMLQCNRCWTGHTTVTWTDSLHVLVHFASPHSPSLVQPLLAPILLQVTTRQASLLTSALGWLMLPREPEGNTVVNTEGQLGSPLGLSLAIFHCALSHGSDPWCTGIDLVP